MNNNLIKATLEAYLLTNREVLEKFVIDSIQKQIDELNNVVVEENWLRTHGYPIIERHIEEDKELFVSIMTDQSVWTPFYDETLRFEVDPIEHYGLLTIKKLVEDLASRD